MLKKTEETYSFCTECSMFYLHLPMVPICYSMDSNILGNWSQLDRWKKRKIVVESVQGARREVIGTLIDKYCCCPGHIGFAGFWSNAKLFMKEHKILQFRLTRGRNEMSMRTIMSNSFLKQPEYLFFLATQWSYVQFYAGYKIYY